MYIYTCVCTQGQAFGPDSACFETSLLNDQYEIPDDLAAVVRKGGQKKHLAQ